jgi:hypothetical protein
MIRAGFGAQMADGKPQMAGTEQMADGKSRWQMAEILPSGTVLNQRLGADGRWQTGFGPVLCHLRIRALYQSLSRLADGVAEAIPTG